MNPTDPAGDRTQPSADAQRIDGPRPDDCSSTTSQSGHEKTGPSSGSGGEIAAAAAAASGQAPVDVPPPPTSPGPDGTRRAAKRRRRRGRLFRRRIRVRVHTFDSFRFRDYRLLWAATTFSSGGFWLQQVTIGWLTYTLTESALLTSLAMSLDMLPLLFVGPLGGVLADRLDRRKAMAAVYAYQALVTVAFASLVLLDRAATWHIFAFITLIGLSWVVVEPARMALIPNIVPRENLVNAIALNALAYSSTRLAAPAAGGLLLAFAGPGPVLLIEVALQLAAVLASLSLRTGMASSSSLRLTAAFSDLVAGIRYVRRSPIVMGLLFIAAVPSLLVMPFIHGLMPVYASLIFDVGPSGLGFLFSSIGAGATAGTIVLASAGDIRRKGPLLIGCMGVLAVAMMAFSRNGSYAVAFPILLALSAALMTVFATTTATVMARVSDEFRGRVSGLFTVTWGLTPAGGVVAGLLAERFGAPTATLLGASGIAVVTLVVALRFKSIWRVD